MRVRVQAEPFDYGAEAGAFARAAAGKAGTGGAGAVVSFAGIVRDRDGGGLLRMEIEHYPGMTETALAAMAETARERWGLADAARHRGEAFAAAEFLMDYLKSRAPFWKKEITAEGADWVAARDADEDALGRW